MPLALLFGALVGLVLGLLGGGGSVLAIPFLTYGVGLDAKSAVATSLVVVGFAALVAAASHARKKNVDFRVALAFGVLGGLGGAIGSQLARWLPGSAQLILLALTMLVLGARMLRDRSQRSDGDPTPRRRATAGKIAAGAIAVGIFTGVVGVGGGFLVVPALVLLVGLPMRTAIGTSLAVIVLNALGGSLGYLSYLALDWGVVVPFALAAGAASLLGGALSQKLSARTLRRSFAIGIVLVGAGMIFAEVTHSLG